VLLLATLSFDTFYFLCETETSRPTAVAPGLERSKSVVNMYELDQE
jgi:hypothetical protein